MSKLFSDDTLAHYGILGMKKNERRWQYEDGRYTPEGKERYFGTKNPRESKEPASGGFINDNKMKNNYKVFTIEDLDKQKPYANNSTFGYYLFSGANKIKKEIENRRKTEEYDEQANLYLKNNKNASIEEDMINTNPYFHTLLENAKNNCPFVTAAYILRRAGYDAVANLGDGMGLNLKASGHSVIDKYAEKLFGKACIKHHMSLDKTYDDISDLSKYKENKQKSINLINAAARKMKNGDVAMFGYNNPVLGYGHIMNMEKEDEKVYMVDAQSAVKFSYKDWMKQYSDVNSYRNYGKIIRGCTIIDPTKIIPNPLTIEKVAHSEFSDETLAHYGTQGQKWYLRRWQYEDGRYTPEGKERYFGTKNPREGKEINIQKTINLIKNNLNKEKIITYINNGKDTINKMLPNRIKNNQIEKNINKEIQKLMLNKNKYSESEYFNKLNKLVNEKNIYNNNLKPNKLWIKKVLDNFSNKTSDIGSKLGDDVIKFILGNYTDNNKKQINKGV